MKLLDFYMIRMIFQSQLPNEKVSIFLFSKTNDVVYLFL